ncbi:putative U3 small nucleolar ribonucleoprotein IMP4 [Hypsibius exemplaris]|uniref:U3 small nucleolar ribonucleoprotein IMP4 n=1 Tax=Hypsibius exemplaris TaxID=2072580 RepID=A0A1W0X7P5_HYPEX|nr:putative U3 small nucleolar ribonucleoprotein IMP4 [Hypsibius exemplaris]
MPPVNKPRQHHRTRKRTSAKNTEISFRHHTYRKNESRKLELEEAGPRMEMKLYQIKLGTIDQLDAADSEWQLKPYMNTAKKRRFLSDDPGFLAAETTPFV